MFTFVFPPTAEYIDKLQDLLFDSVLDQPATFQEFLKQTPVPADLCTEFYQPNKQEAVARHQSRFFNSNHWWSWCDLVNVNFGPVLLCVCFFSLSLYTCGYNAE